MAVVVINSATNNVRANCQTVGISVTHGFTLQNGDILYAFVGQGDDPPTVSPVWTGSAGTWTEIYNNQASTGSDRAFGILRHTVTDAGSEPSSYTFTRNNNATDNLVAAVVQVRGADTTTPDDTTPVGVISTNDFTPNAPDIDTVTTDALILTAHLAAGTAAQYTGGDARTAGAPAEAVLVDSDVYSNGVNISSIFLEVAKWENTGSPGTKTIGSWTGTADDSTSEYVVVTLAIRPTTASTASDTQSLYLKGLSTITDTQAIYVSGQDSLSDTQSIYLLAIGSSTDTQPLYLKGAVSLDDSQSIYLKGSINVADTQAIYINAVVSGTDVADTQGVYLKGSINVDDTQAIYEIGRAHV